jgi:hypothetical protein
MTDIDIFNKLTVSTKITLYLDGKETARGYVDDIMKDISIPLGKKVSHILALDYNEIQIFTKSN